MTARLRFPFRELAAGSGTLMPVLPTRLSLRTEIDAPGIVDSAATVNVLPYSVGLSLGAVWEEQSVRVPLGGVMAGVEARGLLLRAAIGTLAPVQLAFAWAATDSVPVLFGQMNFFREFDLCFFRTSGWFEIGPKKRRRPSVS